MSFSNQEIKIAKKKITICSVIISICWAIFAGFFIPACIFLNDNNVTLFKALSIVLAILSAWVTIYLSANILIPVTSRKNAIKRILGYEEKTYIGVVKDFSNTRTVDKKIEARELEIVLEDDSSFIFYVDEHDNSLAFNVGDKVEVIARYHYLIEAKKI